MDDRMDSEALAAVLKKFPCDSARLNTTVDAFIEFLEMELVEKEDADVRACLESCRRQKAEGLVSFGMSVKLGTTLPELCRFLVKLDEDERAGKIPTEHSSPERVKSVNIADFFPELAQDSKGA
jgi:hypothetical protein